ncbi:MAG: DUF3656 domain-containing protein, partial [Planctomycetota bacterium]|nr:DUF3656 domain-containing protein [Planctomycetota bacterium]
YPTIPEGAPVFCSSSGAVKRRYRFERPKPGAYRRGRIAVFEVEASGGGIRVSGTVEAGPGGVPISGAISLPGDIRPAKDPEKTRLAAEDAFRRLGGTGLEYGGLKLANPRGLFVPKSLFNEARRKIVEVLTRGIAEEREKRFAAVCAEACPDLPGHSASGEEYRPSEAAPPPDRTALAGDEPCADILSGELAGSVPDGAAASATNAQGRTGPEKQGPATGAGTNRLRPVRASGARPAWSVRVQRASAFDAFDGEDWDAVAEAVLDLSFEPADVLLSAAERISAIIGRDRVRFALPAVTRDWEDAALRGKIRALQGAGWNRWEASNLSAWGYLDVSSHPERPLSGPEAASSPRMSRNLPTGREVATAPEFRVRGLGTDSLKGEAAQGPGGDQSRIAGGLCAASGTSGPDIAVDWAVYVVNRMAAVQALEMGASRFTLSPEDGLANMRRLLAEFSDRAAVIVYQDTPLMISESCAWAALTGGCPGSLRCRFSEIEARSERSGDILILNSGCRTVVVGKRPLCLASRLRDLLDAGARQFRAEFSWRRYEPAHVRDIFRSLRAGRDVPGSHQANFDRGLE